MYFCLCYKKYSIKKENLRCMQSYLVSISDFTEIVNNIISFKNFKENYKDKKIFMSVISKPIIDEEDKMRKSNIERNYINEN